MRELENTIEYMINLMGESGVLSYNHPPQKLLTNKSAEAPQERSLKSIEIEMISNLLKKYGDSTEGKKQIAKILGIGIATLYRKIEQYNLKH